MTLGQDRGFLTGGLFSWRTFPGEGVAPRRKPHLTLPSCPQTLCDSAILSAL